MMKRKRKAAESLFYHKLKNNLKFEITVSQTTQNFYF